MDIIRKILLLLATAQVVFSFAVTFRDPVNITSTTTTIVNKGQSFLQSAAAFLRIKPIVNVTLPPTGSNISMPGILPPKNISHVPSNVIGATNVPNTSLNFTSILNSSETNFTTTTTEGPIVPGNITSTIIRANNIDCQSKFETKTSGASYFSDDFIWSKLCPNLNSTVMESYRFDLDAKLCSRLNLQSHCGKNMKFQSYPNSQLYGYCECDYSLGIPLIYHERTRRCYFAYQQGPCKIDEWLEVKGNGSFACSKNKCYNNGRTKFGSPPLAARDMPPEYVPLEGDGPCVLLNRPNEHHCGNKLDEVSFRMWPRILYPLCGPPRIGRFVGDVAPLECNPGSFHNVMGVCQPDWEFD